LGAVAERHASPVRAITDRLEGIPTATWRRLTAEEAIGELLLPYADYVRRHPDFVPLMRRPTLGSLATGFSNLIDGILARRLPLTPKRERQTHAEFLHAVATGTVHLAYQLDPSKLDVWLEDVRRMLVTCLVQIEERADMRVKANEKTLPRAATTRQSRRGVYWI